jgi:hypothetical protein
VQIREASPPATRYSILLFSRLMACSQANITDGDRKSARMVSMRFPDTELRPANREFRRVLEDYPFVHVILKGVAVVGVCLMIAGKVMERSVIVVANICCAILRRRTHPSTICPRGYPRQAYLPLLKHVPLPISNSQTNT